MFRNVRNLIKKEYDKMIIAANENALNIYDKIISLNLSNHIKLTSLTNKSDSLNFKTSVNELTLFKMYIYKH